MDTSQGLDRGHDSHAQAAPWDTIPFVPVAAPELLRSAPFDNRAPAAVPAALDGALSPLIGAMRMGAILVAVDGQVGYLNEAARDSLDGDSGLALRGDRIVATSPDIRRKFAAALHAACRAPFADGAVLLGPRRGAGAARPLRVLAMERIGGRTPQAEHGLALLCLQAKCERTPDPQMLTQLFGLTGAEAMLMAGIAGGRRLHQCAAQRGVSLATVRAQLRNVFVKTGAGTQADLTFIAWSIPGLWID